VFSSTIATLKSCAADGRARVSRNTYSELGFVGLLGWLPTDPPGSILRGLDLWGGSGIYSVS
jgi:hypothetical protein